MKDLKELVKERNEAANVIEEMRKDDALIDGSDSLNEERWSKANDAYDALDKQIQKHERADEIAARQAASQDSRTGRDSERGDTREGAPSNAEDRSQALQGWMRSQSDLEPTDEQRDAAKRLGVRLNAKSFDVKIGDTRDVRKAQAEYRAQSVGTDSAGGYTVPEGFVANLEKAKLHFGGMNQVASIVRTAEGNQLPWPTVNDTGNAGVLLGENTQVAEQDVVFGEKVFNAYKYSSKLVRVSQELLEDSAFDMASELGSMLGERLGRILNTQFTTGTGSAQPNGIVTASTLGVTAAGAAAITFDEIIDLEHSVDVAYRMGAKYMLADATLKLVRKLKDSDLGYIWNRADAGAPAMLNGYEYVVNNDMPAATTGLKSVLFGDMTKYKIREVNSIRIKRLVERYADYDQEGFVAFIRADGELLNAGTNPVKHLIQL